MPTTRRRPLSSLFAPVMLVLLPVGLSVIIFWASASEKKEISLHAIETVDGFELLGGGMQTTEYFKTLKEATRAARGRAAITGAVIVRFSSTRQGVGLNGKQRTSRVLMDAVRTDRADLLVMAHIGDRMITHRTGRPLQIDNSLAGLELSPKARRHLGLDGAEDVDATAVMDELLQVTGGFFAQSSHFGLAHMAEEIRRGGGEIRVSRPKAWIVLGLVCGASSLLFVTPYLVVRWRLRHLIAQERESQELEALEDDLAEDEETAAIR